MNDLTKPCEDEDPDALIAAHLDLILRALITSDTDPAIIRAVQRWRSKLRLPHYHPLTEPPNRTNRIIS